MLVVRDTDSGVEVEFPGVPSPEVPIEDNKHIPQTSGVYFAHAAKGDGWECVYVGESKNMRRRLECRPELAGTRLGFICCDRQDRKRIESVFIAFLNPRLNAQSTRVQGRRVADDEVCQLVLEATKANANLSRSGRAHYKTTARMCHMRPKDVRPAWAVLARAGKISISGDFAVVQRGDNEGLPSQEGYIVLADTNGDPRGRSHGWIGHDTACRMWSTGGLPRHKRWTHSSTPATDLCNQCANVRRQKAGEWKTG